jgi:hypothetical protein
VTRLHLAHFVQCDLVVATDDRRRAQLAKILGQIEGERVVIIEEKYHR